MAVAEDVRALSPADRTWGVASTWPGEPATPAASLLGRDQDTQLCGSPDGEGRGVTFPPPSVVTGGPGPGHGHSGRGTAFVLLLLLPFLLQTAPASDLKR